MENQWNPGKSESSTARVGLEGGEMLNKRAKEVGILVDNIQEMLASSIAAAASINGKKKRKGQKQIVCFLFCFLPPPPKKKET